MFQKLPGTHQEAAVSLVSTISFCAIFTKVFIIMDGELCRHTLFRPLWWIHTSGIELPHTRQHIRFFLNSISWWASGAHCLLPTSSVTSYVRAPTIQSEPSFSVQHWWWRVFVRPCSLLLAVGKWACYIYASLLIWFSKNTAWLLESLRQFSMC